MIKKPILKISDLKAEFGTTQMLTWDSDFRLGRTSGFTLDGMPENLHITVLNDNSLGTSYPSLTNHSVVEVKHLRELGRSSRYMIINKKLLSTIDVESMVEIAKKVSEKVMPGRWYFDGNYMYYYYPKITLKNSINLTHNIYNLVVRVSMSDTYFSDSLQGIRFSFTSKELVANYAHSHLPSVNGFQNFCTGSGSKFKALLTSMKEEFSDHTYTMFLMQLEYYLSWESVEGKPHKYIVELTGKAAAAPSISIGSDVIHYFSDSLLRFIPVGLTTKVGDTVVFDPGLDPDMYLRAEAQAVEHYLASVRSSLRTVILDYDLDTGEYVRSTDNTTLPNKALDYASLIAAFGIQPRLITEEQSSTRTLRLIKRPATNLLEQVIIEINRRLSRYNKF